MKPGLLSLVIASSIAAGCAPPVDRPLPSEELRAAQETAWLVRRVSFLPEVNGVAHGYDVDGVDSLDGREGTDCASQAEDYASALHPALTGVDAAGWQLIQAGESLFGFSFAAELDRAIAEGRLRWAIRVGSLSPDESSLTIDLVAIDPGSEIALDSGGLPAAGQSLSGVRIATAHARVDGSSAAGDAVADGLPVDGDVSLLPFTDYRLAGVVLDASVAESGTLLADLGGSFSVEGLMLETMRLAMDPDGDFSLARRLYEEVADLEPSADPSVCTRITVGFALEAVPLELTFR